VTKAERRKIEDMPLFKNGEQKSKIGPVWGLAPVGRGRI
jgi:hypothetical protein